MRDAARENILHLAESDGGELPSGLSRSFLELLCMNISGGLLGGYLRDGFPLYCVNDYMIEHLGYADYSAFVADIDGQVMNGMHPDDRAQIGRQVNERMRAGQTYEVRYRMRRADGDYIWVNDIGRRVVDDAGREICISTIRDITKEVESKRELERREQRYDRLFESVVCGIVQYELTADEGRVIFHSANPEAIRIFGYTPAQFAAKEDWRLPALIHPDDRAQILKSAASLQKPGDKDSFEYRLLRRDGTACWIIGTAERIDGPDGVPMIQSVFMDIDRRKKAELQNFDLLRRSRMSDELLRLALQDTDIYAVHYYPGERRLIVPARTRERYGWQAAYENIPESLAGFVHSDDRAAMGELFSHLAAGRHTASCEFRTADGRFWVRLTLSAVEAEENGRVTSAVGLIEDRTGQRRAESAHSALSRLNQEVMRSLDRLFFGVYRIDLRAGSIRAVRAPAEQDANGLTEQDSPYDPIRLSTLYHPDDRAAFCRELSLDTLRRQQAEGVRSVEGEYRRKINGEYRWVSRVVYLNNTDFGSESAIIVLTDVSDRRRQQNVLHALSREYFALYYIDLEEDMFQTIRTSPTTDALLDVSHHTRYSETIRQYILKLVHPDDRAAVSAFCALSSLHELTAEQPERRHTFRKLVGENYEWMQMRFILSSDSGGAPPSVTLAVRNIDEDIRQQLETKQLLEDALRRAENANMAKSDFLSKMSHDIRTPMNAIIGMTALAAAGTGDEARVRDCLDKIALSSKHLLGLINEVLDMSKIESGKLDLNLARTSLPELIEGSLLLVQPNIEQKHLHLTVDLKHIKHKQAKCDALRLQQILVNILSNACKYTPDGGSIHFCAAELPASRPGHGQYRLLCRDTGIGMSEDFQKHLFEPFARADDTRTSRQNGTGLGMAIAYNLVRMMGGTITCESKLGAGTAFTVTLTLELADGAVEPAAVPVAEGKRRSLAGKRLLLVEDNALNQEIAQEFLRMAGAEVISVDDGQQAVDRFAASAPHAFDAILMDIRMPIMDGYAATRAIRALSRPDAAIIPIIAMTADAFAEDVQRAKDAGMNAHIAKPVDVDQLLRLLSLWT
ncbi:PAS domain-containing protein [Agathobaculum sp. NTUH-O15-33]|uniref:PAS domain-containing protein n=1 Tax=Agathobaculum sp. NTUH-O15-33 TaxID=3079302 RepID=UPI002958ADCC|nr:PAS domain-containing protein [Agathobaculum sp. NTUH-O15-33]WNX84489.1 PAS domain-containing protein [Agathobaculum sp. NTUH-O15-33]